MDRLDAMQVFVAALEEGSLAGAGRRLGRSAAAVTRAIASLERRVGVRLLDRTTRTMRLTEAGERYVVACRRMLLDLEEADLQAVGERAAPRGLLTITAPVVAGTRIVRPILDAFLDTHPAVKARLLLLDRTVNLVDEGVDAGLRIGHLPDSDLIAIRVGTVRRVVCAAPAYLARRGPIGVPGDLAVHDGIALTQFPQGDVWSFPAQAGGGQLFSVRVPSRLTVNTIDAALDSAIDGHGVIRVLSYQVTHELRAGRLVLMLEGFEPPPLPVHLIAPQGRLAVAKVRAFVDFARHRLKTAFAQLADRP